jgi:hypothetical protein
MQIFTIIAVHHEDPRPDAVLTASIWIAAGDRRAEVAEEVPDDRQGWFRLSGPIDLNAAVDICSSLESFFSQNGIQILKETIAD